VTGTGMLSRLLRRVRRILRRLRNVLIGDLKGVLAGGQSAVARPPARSTSVLSRRQTGKKWLSPLPGIDSYPLVLASVSGMLPRPAANRTVGTRRLSWSSVFTIGVLRARSCGPAPRQPA